MENASEALLIGAGILIAIVILSIGVSLFTSYSEFGSSYEQTITASEIAKFNSRFTKFLGREDITVQEIVTLAQFAKEQEVDVICASENINEKNNKATIEFIEDNSFNGDERKMFKCVGNDSIEYDENTGLVNKITFTY